MNTSPTQPATEVGAITPTDVVPSSSSRVATAPATPSLAHRMISSFCADNLRAAADLVAAGQLDLARHEIAKAAAQIQQLEQLL